MDKREPVKRQEPKRLSLVLLWNGAVVIVIAAFLSWRVLRAREFSNLANRLGYSGPAEEFPMAFFRERVPLEAPPGDVWNRMRGHSTVRYYIAPIIGTSDSVVVQRFGYPMRWDRLDVDVEYLRGGVRNIDVRGDESFGMQEIPPSEAYERLGWRPTKMP